MRAADLAGFAVFRGKRIKTEGNLRLAHVLTSSLITVRVLLWFPDPLVIKGRVCTSSFLGQKTSFDTFVS